ncbi:MAG: hypothetical protein IT371_27280 [Deltaproteobacteria bacterium]|nr:hypothetical protein [Deltaproteobacteria bacterium]
MVHARSATARPALSVALASLVGGLLLALVAPVRPALAKGADGNPSLVRQLFERTRGRLHRRPTVELTIVARETLPAAGGASTPEPTRTIRWTRQRNGHDCGPALLLNSMQMLGITVPHTTMAAVRTAVNTAREARKDRPRAAYEWLSNLDLNGYLATYAGLSAETCQLTQASGPAPLLTSLSARPFRLLYMMSNNHFTGVTPAEERGKYWYLDSFAAGPERIDARGLAALLLENIPSLPGEAGLVTVLR